ncbi:MAG: ribonuclease, partial [Roseomonas sp.]|nr:ribonuclease [Roseomonas sp.]
MPMASDIFETAPPEAETRLVEIWTDGGCKPNPGPGGWAAILRYGGVERELCGHDPATTNNRMELTAAAEALEALKRPCTVVIHTDSEYVRNGISRWINGWVRNNWRNAAKDPVA